MLVPIDKRGSINPPTSLRKQLELKNGDHLDFSLVEGGSIILQPVIIASLTCYILLPQLPSYASKDHPSKDFLTTILADWLGATP